MMVQFACSSRQVCAVARDVGAPQQSDGRIRKVRAEIEGSFYWVSFSQRGASYYRVPGGGVWGRVQGVVGVAFLWKMRGKGGGGGEGGRVGLGRGEGAGKSMRTRLSKLAFSKLSFSFSPKGQTCRVGFADGPLTLLS